MIHHTLHSVMILALFACSFASIECSEKGKKQNQYSAGRGRGKKSPSHVYDNRNTTLPNSVQEDKQNRNTISTNTLHGNILEGYQNTMNVHEQVVQQNIKNEKSMAGALASNLLGLVGYKTNAVMDTVRYTHINVLNELKKNKFDVNAVDNYQRVQDAIKSAIDHDDAECLTSIVVHLYGIQYSIPELSKIEAKNYLKRKEIKNKDDFAHKIAALRQDQIEKIKNQHDLIAQFYIFQLTTLAQYAQEAHDIISNNYNIYEADTNNRKTALSLLKDTIYMSNEEIASDQSVPLNTSLAAMTSFLEIKNTTQQALTAYYNIKL